MEAFQNSDLIIAVGTKFSDRTYSPHTEPSKKCRVIQIDIDATQFGKSNRTSVDIKCDAKKALDLLIDALGGETRHDPWTRQVKEWKKRCTCNYDYYTSPIVPQKVMKELNSFFDEDTIITTDVGQNQMWAMHFLDVKRPRQLLSSGSFGFLYAWVHWGENLFPILVGFFLSALIVWMHRSNIVRLVKGEERKTNLFGKGTKQ